MFAAAYLYCTAVRSEPHGDTTIHHTYLRGGGHSWRLSRLVLPSLPARQQAYLHFRNLFLYSVPHRTALRPTLPYPTLPYPMLPYPMLPYRCPLSLSFPIISYAISALPSLAYPAPT